MTGNGAVSASYGDLLVTSLLVLGAVCVAAFLAVRIFGRVLATGRSRGTHLMDVVARVPLEPRRSLYVVEVAGKTLLVGTSEMGLSVLSELDAAEVKSRVVPRQSFAELVRAAWQRRRGLASAGAAATSPDADIRVGDAGPKLPVRESNDEASRASDATPNAPAGETRDKAGRASDATPNAPAGETRDKAGRASDAT